MGKNTMIPHKQNYVHGWFTTVHSYLVDYTKILENKLNSPQNKRGYCTIHSCSTF